MQYPADFLIAPDDGVEVAVFSPLIEVDGVFSKGVVGVLGALIGHFCPFAEFFDCFSEGWFCCAQFFE